MNIENLILCKPYKYKELCGVLGIEPKGGNAKIAQFKELERYCKHHKEGHKIFIDQIYSKELPKVDKRANGNNNEQSKCIRYILLNLLSGYRIESNEVIGFSKGLLLRKLNMINDNYVTAKVKREAYAEALDVDKMAIDECIDYIDDRSFKAIKRAIDTLVKIKLLGYKYSYTWVDHKGEHHHTTSILEHNKIMEVEREVMKQMRVSHKGKVFEYGRWEEFKSRVKQGLLKNYSELFPKLSYYYTSFHFHYNIEQIQDYMREMEKQGMSYERAIEGVKELWNNSLDKTIRNYHKKAKEKVPFGNCFDDRINYMKSEQFIPQVTKTKDSLVKKEYEIVEIHKETSEQLKMDLDEIPF